jgi:hypothetical protein
MGLLDSADHEHRLDTGLNRAVALLIGSTNLEGSHASCDTRRIRR